MPFVLHKWSIDFSFSLFCHPLFVLNLMLVVANFANSKWCKKPEKWLKPWHMRTHLRVLSESYQMNTNMTGFKCFSKIFVSLCFGWKKPLHSNLSFSKISQEQHKINLSFSLFPSTRCVNREKEIEVAKAMTRLQDCSPADMNIQQKLCLDVSPGGATFPYQQAVEELERMTRLVCPLSKMESTG